MTRATLQRLGPAAAGIGFAALFLGVQPSLGQEEGEDSPLTLGAYAEVDAHWNFAQPDNGVTNFRGFDNRDATFTITNVALDAQWDDGSTVGRVALQVGHTPSTYYLAEPSLPGTSGANATNGELWKYVQQAYVGNRFGEEEDLLATAGVFLSPIGPEGIAIKDNWNWSRSNLFFALPFYHTGLRAAKTIDDRWTATAGVVNGWNSVVDNNRDKSIFGQITWSEADHLTASALYFGGVERGEGAPEGSAWRHLFDAHATWNATSRLALLAHADAGFEDNDFGTSSWVGAAGAARYQVASSVFVAGRADYFDESVASNDSGSASSIFFPVEWVSSVTGTLEYRPSERSSWRLEVRHDEAEDDLFFGEDAPIDDSTGSLIPDESSQTTLTLGVTAWI